MLLNIIWNFDPVLFEIAGREIRWYGLLLAIGFLLAYIIIGKTMRKEGYSQKRIDAFTMFVIIGTIIGLRLGHCFFYGPYFDVIDPETNTIIERGYLSHPLDILKVWEGGLASHGGAIGILLAVFIFTKVYKESFLGLMDRVALVVPLAGGMVRLGNLCNSEILGSPTSLPWGFVFKRSSEYYNLIPVNTIPLHPAQLYEAIFYFIMFIALYFVYKKYHSKWANGCFLGLFLIILFSFRFFIEFIKLPQTISDTSILDSLGIDTGQLLSIPFIILGIILLLRSYYINKRKKIVAKDTK